MPSVVVVGAQFGDEGKGKIVDFLAGKADLVVRFNGGNNAGHTVVVKKEKHASTLKTLVTEKFKFHLIPSGAVRGKKIVCGAGMVIDPAVLVKEIESLEKSGYKPDLLISFKAHVIMPYHRVFDVGKEKTSGEKRIGTTGKGIGPTYSDKMRRHEAIRVCDLISSNFKDKLDFTLKMKVDELIEYGVLSSREQIENYRDQIYGKYSCYAEKIKEFVGDDSLIVNEALDKGLNVLFEGAQGTLLDVDHGTYPYVTSSNAVAGGCCTGVGIGPTRINRVVGVAKAYTTRVGEGPFPTEIKGELADLIREKGGEYGTTTGRPRRCGWLDMVMLRYSKRVNGLTELALTKIDVLSGINPLKICVAYELRDEEITEFPASNEDLEKCEPIYVQVPGWREIEREEWSEIALAGFDSLPREAREYIKFIEGKLDLPITIVSVGPERSETIIKPITPNQ